MFGKGKQEWNNPDMLTWGFYRVHKAVARGGGGATGACAPPFKK